jgi:peroxiredoxin
MKVKLGQKLDRFSVRTTRGRTLAVPDPTHRYTHLQFRRFAGCPICNFHLHTFVNSIEKLHAASIREVVVFHSSLREMVKHQDQLPFDTVADPTKALYKEYGVETSITAPLHPRAMAASIKGIALGKMGLKMENGPLGLPADILIDDRGVVVAVKYGTHAYDQWEVEELLRLAANADLVRLRRLAEA